MIRVAASDAGAFVDLYRSMLPPVRVVVGRTLRDPAQTDEVAQEVLLEVWLKAAAFDPRRGAASSWILHIAAQRAVDRVRTVEAQRARDRRLACVAPSDLSDTVVEDVLQHLAAERVQAALRDLTENKRQALLLAYYDGHSYAAAAEIAGVPVGTMKTRIRDALIQLRCTLQESGLADVQPTGERPGRREVADR